MKTTKFLLAGLFVLALTSSSTCYGGNFPDVEQTSGTESILESYPPYLHFVLVIGKRVNPRSAKRLRITYSRLRKKDPRGAARFLKGLRYELVNKIRRHGYRPASVTTRSRMMRQWVKRYLPLWHREADEHLFRWRARGIVRRAAK